MNGQSLIITIPKTTSWEDYEKEIKDVEEKGLCMKFKVPSFPLHIQATDRCYVVYKGVVKGWMEIVALTEEEFECETTGKIWKGKFIVRGGKFHRMQRKITYPSFQSFRYIKTSIMEACE